MISVRALGRGFAAMGVLALTGLISTGGASALPTQPVHAQAPTIPFLCHNGKKDNFIRFTDCFDVPWHFKLFKMNTDRLMGKVSGHLDFWNSLSYKSRDWTENIELKVTHVSGAGHSSSMKAPLTCIDKTPGDCKLTGFGNWNGQSIFLSTGTSITYSGDLGFRSTSTSTTRMGLKVTLIIKSPDTKPGIAAFGPTTDIRCDSEAIFKPTKGGCVYENYQLNLFELSTKDKEVKESAQFILDAQNEIPNHIGQVDAKGLTRTTDGKKMQANRRKACGKVHPPKGKSCDEYPFASTNQGAAQVPTGFWKRRIIDAAQNSKAGSQLSTFFLKNRIMNGDQFFVGIRT